MIDTHTEELAALFVLDSLTGDELKAFERRLEAEPELAELVRQLSDGFHAPMRSVAGPDRMDLLAGIHEQLGLVEDKADARTPVRFKWTIGWAAAAAVLLVVNIQQFRIARKGTESMERELQAIRESQVVLAEENRTMRAFNQSWETEYMNLAERMLPFFESRDGIGSFTVIDLVNVKNQSVDSKDPDLDDLAEYFLSAGTSMQSPQEGATFASVQLQNNLSTRESATVGFVAWRNDEGRGFLDVYNLPDSRLGFGPFLWVRSKEASSYIPVGYLPPLENGSGPMSFTVDHDNFVPAEILITEESEDGPGKNPSSYQLMAGP